MDRLYLNSKILSLKFPISTFFFYFGKKKILQKQLLKLAFRWSNFKDQTLNDFDTYWNEIISNDMIPLNNPDLKVNGNSLSSTFGKWIYIVVRATKADKIVETGVSHGYSSWVILNAIHKNQKGKLYSIDLAGNDTNADYNLSQNKIGQVVPSSLSHNWTLIIGDVAEKLPELLKELKEIDLFFHDSDHSYLNMKFEFNESLKHLKENGLILSDDIHKNEAFNEFVSKYNFKSCYFTKGGMSFVKKQIK
jgi:predicted O-methyltransferase YrrM